MSKNDLSAAASTWIAVLAMSFASQVGATGWTADVTPTAVSHTIYGGEIVQVAIAEAVDNSAGCSLQDAYVIREPNHVKAALALLTAALVSGRKVNLFVTGTCDAAGRPNVVGITLR